MSRMKFRTGFTLVEIMVAIVFIAIALISIASAFTNASHILQKSRHTLTAVGYLQKWAEFYRNESFTDISSIPLGTWYSLDVSDAPLLNAASSIYSDGYDGDGDLINDSDIRKISLRISWNESSGTITKNMVTLVTENGINP